MWKYLLDRVGPHPDTIRHRHVACWINMSKDTHTLKLCNNYCFSTATMVTRTRLNITFIPIFPALWSLVMRLRMSGFLSPFLHTPSCRAERQLFISTLQPNNVPSPLISTWPLSDIQFGGDSESADVKNDSRSTISWPQRVFTKKHINFEKNHEVHAVLNHYFFSMSNPSFPTSKRCLSPSRLYHVI
jgi:hypothetical protein